MSFENKSVVITGGNSGIGLAFAELVHARGANVVIFGRNKETLDAAAAKLGERCLAVRGDVAKLADLDVLFEATRDRFGGIDHLVVNAGIAKLLPLADADEAHFDQLFDVNVKGAFFTIKKAEPLLRDNASVVIVSSVAGQKGFAGTSVYSATKAAVRSFARTLSADLLPRGIRVNVVSPGPIETPIFERMGFTPEQAVEAKAGFTEAVPLKRMGTPDEVADAIAFLSAPSAGYIVGVDLTVDGGMVQL